MSCSSYRFIKTEYYDDNFNGYKAKPRMVETKTYKYLQENSSNQKDLISVRRKYYDGKGRFVEDSTFRKDGNFTIGSRVEYLRNGRLHKATHYNKGNSVYNQENFIYSKNLLSSIVDSHDIVHFFYDSEGRKIKTETVPIDKEKSYRIVKFYDSNSLATKHEYYDDHKLKSVFKYSYNDDGNQIKQEVYDSNQRLKNYTLREYDNLKNMNFVRSFKIKERDTIVNFVMKFEYSYDENDNYVTMKLYQNDIPQYFYEYKYNY